MRSILYYKFNDKFKNLSQNYIQEIILWDVFIMSEKMLVTQALDDRDLLVKKIQDRYMKKCIKSNH